ncbi:MAG: hypothetical protein ACREIL_02085 [Nitrospiraceae bacterium]
MQGLVKRVQPVGIAEVAGRFESWRRSHPKRSPLPDELWREAADLARAHGIHPVARALNLAYYDLKRHAEAVRPAFVEVSVCPPAATAERIVEMERPDGARMKVRCAGPGDLVALSESFWRRRA